MTFETCSFFLPFPLSFFLVEPQKNQSFGSARVENLPSHSSRATCKTKSEPVRPRRGWTNLTFENFKMVNIVTYEGFS
jgi:hypothetical protein